MEATTTISKWGNSKGVRVPAEILKKAQTAKAFVFLLKFSEKLKLT